MHLRKCEAFVQHVKCKVNMNVSAPVAQHLQLCWPNLFVRTFLSVVFCSEMAQCVALASWQLDVAGRDDLLYKYTLRTCSCSRRLEIFIFFDALFLGRKLVQTG